MVEHRVLLDARILLAKYFPNNFSSSRFPYTYHHDYARQYDIFYHGMSRSEIGESLENRYTVNSVEYLYELILWSALYLVSNYTDEFSVAITTSEFWNWFSSLRTLETFKKTFE